MKNPFTKKLIGILCCAALIVVIVVAVAVGSKKGESRGRTDTEANSEATVSHSSKIETPFESPEELRIRKLIRAYYDLYALGDTDALDQIVTHLSDSEKSFIDMFSEHVDSYDNLSCYAKPVPEKDAYIVNAKIDINFTGVDTPAPGLDFFYVETDENGDFYINNLYSQFNSLVEEQSVDPEIRDLIAAYEKEEDVIRLQNEVTAEYEKAVASDPALAELVSTKIRDAYVNWSAANKPNAQAEPETEPEMETEIEPETETETEPEAEPETETKTETETEAETETEIETETETETEAGTEAEPETETEKKEEASNVATFSPGEKIYIKSAVSVRMEMSETSKKVGAAHEGDTVKVIQSYAEGWTKVEWMGKTGYIRSDLLKFQ